VLLQQTFSWVLAARQRILSLAQSTPSSCSLLVNGNEHIASISPMEVCHYSTLLANIYTLRSRYGLNLEGCRLSRPGNCACQEVGDRRLKKSKGFWMTDWSKEEQDLVNCMLWKDIVPQTWASTRTVRFQSSVLLNKGKNSSFLMRFIEISLNSATVVVNLR